MAYVVAEHVDSDAEQGTTRYASNDPTTKVLKSIGV